MRSTCASPGSASLRDERRTPSRRVPRAVMGVLALIAVAVAAAMDRVPVVVPLAYALMSLASFLLYWWDKDAAGAKRWRTAEDTLHLLDLLGGWPGALIAQQQFRHKTVKASFQTMFWITVLLNAAGMAWLVRSGAVDELTRWLTEQASTLSV